MTHPNYRRQPVELFIGCPEKAVNGIHFTTTMNILDDLKERMPRHMRDFSYEDETRIVKNWCRDFKAHYHGWHGESHQVLAEENKAAADAAAAGKSIVVMDYMS
jgi:hypothetical protein